MKLGQKVYEVFLNPKVPPWQKNMVKDGSNEYFINKCLNTKSETS